jgi:hypothetical protein
VLRGVVYHIQGKTREFALERVLRIREGERFNGLGELEAYAEEKNRELRNLRTLDSAASGVSYTLGEPEGLFIPVYLDVVVTDTWNFMVLPEPKYDSNSGFTLSVKARDYNFMGTLTPFRFGFVWGDDDDGERMVGFLMDLDFPFLAWGHRWNITFDHDFRYYFDIPVYYKNITGISLEFPLPSSIITLGFDQGLVIHEKDRDAKKDGQFHDWYQYSMVYAGWEIPTPLRAGWFGGVSYLPKLYGNINYQPGGDVGDYRRGPNAGLEQSLGFGRIDWIGNFRRGLETAVFFTSDYNFFHRDWDHSAGLKAAGHWNVSRFFGLSGRLLYTAWLDDSYDLGGDALRGYKDDQLELTQRLSLNLDFPFRLIRFVPSEWTGKKKVRVFDFEQHWAPFIDIAMLEGNGYEFTPGDMVVCAGLEILVFPLTWRSLYIRGSAGWNIREWVKSGTMPGGIFREIFVGVGHFY